MFTGIIEEIGVLSHCEHKGKSSKITIEAKAVLQGIKLGDSIAVNGVCVTVTSFSRNTFSADVMSVTLEKTNLGKLSFGKCVNLERALFLGERLGGHLVSGHVDCMARVLTITKNDNILIEVALSHELKPFILSQGSVTLDGVSLTVAKVTPQSFFVSIIPLTAKETIIGAYKPGTIINIETDMVGKYLYHFYKQNTSNIPKKKPLTKEFLIGHGF